MTFSEAIDAQKPHILIGATGVRGTFTEEVVKKMTSLNERPVIFALSNPTDRAECTAQQATTGVAEPPFSRAGVLSGCQNRGREAVASRPGQ